MYPEHVGFENHVLFMKFAQEVQMNHAQQVARVHLRIQIKMINPGFEHCFKIYIDCDTSGS